MVITIDGMMDGLNDGWIKKCFLVRVYSYLKQPMVKKYN